MNNEGGPNSTETCGLPKADHTKVPGNEPCPAREPSPDEARVREIAAIIERAEMQNDIDGIDRYFSDPWAIKAARAIATLPAAPADGVGEALNELSQAREILNAVACGFWTEDQTELSTSMAAHAGQAIEMLDAAAESLSRLQPVPDTGSEPG